MTPIDFCYWLQGYFELTNSNELTPEQVVMIRKHLNLVFLHTIDPLREKETTAPKDSLDATHHGIGPNTLIRC